MDFGKLPEISAPMPVRRRRFRLWLVVPVLLGLAVGVWWRIPSGRAKATPPAEGAPPERAVRPQRVDFEAKTAALNAGGVDGDIEGQLRRARTAAAAGRNDEAAGLLAGALAAQRSLNARFAGSRLASLERLDQIEAERQTQLAVAGRREVAELERRLDAHLQRRELFQAQRLAAEAAQRLAADTRRLPKASNRDEPLRQKLDLVATRGRDLARVQDEIYDSMLPLPGEAGRSMTRTEITQSAYVELMNLNPSRHAGTGLPVDSVNHADAAEFCRRLSWILGWPVRLPAEAEYRAAADPAPTDAAVTAWGAENSAGRPHPVGSRAPNPAGFCDLLGNVAEWLGEEDGTPSDGSAPLAGGSFASPAGELRQIPVVRAARTTRAATNGFRVVVEMQPSQ